MPGRIDKPKQLQLDLSLGYLKHLDSTCEKFDFYETMTKALLGEYANSTEKSPFWEEINNLNDY